MAVVHRALFTWFLLLVFLILMVLRLDEKTSWNWFIVFIPMWLFDTIMLIYVVLKIVTHCKTGHDGLWLTMSRKAWYLAGVFLKIAFQTTLCAKLEYQKDLALYYVFIPLWLVLLGVCIDVFKDLIDIYRY